MIFRPAWRQAVSERLEATDGYGASVVRVHEQGGIFANWSLLGSPQSPAIRHLDYAVKIACGAWNHPYQHLFLDWANQTAERALADPRFEVTESTRIVRGWKVEGVYPGNHGETLAAAVIARAMQDDEPLNWDLCVQAAREIAQTALESKGADWDDWTTQGSYLRAVQLLVIAGETDEAKALFKIKRSFKHVSIYFEWLKAFVMEIPEDAPMHVASRSLAQHFDERFDIYRDPQYRPAPSDDTMGGHLGQNLMLLRLELALIKQRYVLGKTSRGHWEQIVGLISR